MNNTFRIKTSLNPVLTAEKISAIFDKSGYQLHEGTTLKGSYLKNNRNLLAPKKSNFVFLYEIKKAAGYTEIQIEIEPQSPVGLFRKDHSQDEFLLLRRQLVNIFN